MTNLISIRRRERGKPITPEIVAMERVHAGNSCERMLALNDAGFQAIQSSLDKLLDLAMSRRSLPEGAADQIEAIGGLDHEEVFDLAFTAHFEISAALDATKLLQAVFPKR